MTDQAAIARLLGDYAWRVSPEVLDRVADGVARLESLSLENIGRLAASVHDPGMRHETSTLLERWRAAGAEGPELLSAMLRGAASAIEARKESQSTDLVWTGPSSSRMLFRRTDEALLEVVRAARNVL